MSKDLLLFLDEISIFFCFSMLPHAVLNNSRKRANNYLSMTFSRKIKHYINESEHTHTYTYIKKMYVYRYICRLRRI